MKVLTGTLILLLALSASLSASAGKSGYYRWTDDEGKPHFTQKPPHDRPYEFIPDKAPWADRDAAEAAEPGADEAPQPPRAAAQPTGQVAPKQMEVLPEKNAQTCEQARQALAQINNRAVRIRVTDEAGNQRLISEEEREQERQRAQETISIYCE